MKRMDEERMVKTVISNVEGDRCRGGPRLRWMDGFRGEGYVSEGRLNWIEGGS